MLADYGLAEPSRASELAAIIGHTYGVASMQFVDPEIRALKAGGLGHGDHLNEYVLIGDSTVHQGYRHDRQMQKKGMPRSESQAALRPIPATESSDPGRFLNGKSFTCVHVS